MSIVIKPTIYVDTYEQVMEYIENEKNIDGFIFDSIVEFEKDDELEIVELNIECKEIPRILKIIYERDRIPVILESALKRSLLKEEYEECARIRDLITKFTLKK